MTPGLMAPAGQELADRLDQVRRDERRRAMRTLLMQPLLYADHPAYGLAKRHAHWLRDWLMSETRWTLHIEADFARLAKHAPPRDDGSRAARPGNRPSDLPFSRRRYALLCLVLAALERGESQTTLGRLGRVAVDYAADPALTAAGLEFTLRGQSDRRDLVAVVRLLLRLGVLARVAGNEDAYVRSGERDVLYDIDRRVLSSLLVTRRGPSLVIGFDPAPTTLDGRIDAISASFVADTPEARNREIRQQLTEQLLDDPVLYLDRLNDEQRTYLAGQRHAIVQRIHEATGLIPEIRAEGIAMIDPAGELSDLPMPAEGSEGHISLLLADLLAGYARTHPQAPSMPWDAIHAAYRDWVTKYGRYWKKAAREPGAEREFTEQAAQRLSALGLAELQPGGVTPLPAVARYALDTPRISRTTRDLAGQR